MDSLKEILNDKSIKRLEKRSKIVNFIINNEFSTLNFAEFPNNFNDKQISIILEAIEEITNKNIIQLNSAFLHFGESCILSKDNSCKREAARIVGNMASYYPNELDDAIQKLLINTRDESKVVRWSSAYALSRIILIKDFQTNNLLNQIKEISDNEDDNGVKNQYVKALKKISKQKK